MKRIWSFWSLGIVLLLIALLLTGCGKKNSPPTDPVTSKIHFRIPGIYRVQGLPDPFPVPQGKTLKIYVVSDDLGENEPIVAEKTFIATTTGKSAIFSFDLPSELVGKKRSFIAVVILKEDFDPDEKTKNQLFTAVGEGDILLGLAQDGSQLKQYNITSGLTVEDFEFWGGVAIGEPQDFEISIKMPAVYEDVDYGSKHPIPSGKTVKFYFFQDNQDIDEDQPLNPILTITGTTRDKESRILGTVPVGLNGKECYLFAVVVLEGDFGLEGKTQADIEADIEKALKNKSILLGQILDEQDPTGWKRYTLNPDLPPIEDFEFIGSAI